ncbi:tyrosine-type recombinase/integrase [Nonomuraea jiangxiensis]|uniref:Phage integrase family protein n=1 Tax=Nonomuraea jiangxiensis TaxID=633440 RepID=A0A1G8WTW0_9ACTN|nr:tyrosine-type recombinase/integrase [Nonomuraea jiangxiensis]SDJ81496.1 Phage integrase family protein [Nonomuraea jiangxiensis]
MAAADVDFGLAWLRTAAFIRVLVRTGSRVEEAISAELAVPQLTGRIFVTDTGGRFYRSSASGLVARIGRRAGIAGKVTPYMLRRTWASMAKELGTNAVDIKEALDHESVDTTMIYLHPANQLKEILPSWWRRHWSKRGAW